MNASKRTATLILNRNLPHVTDALYENIAKTSGSDTDIYVIESGSASDGRSRYAAYAAGWEESIANGLRYPRGFNYGLSELHKEGKFAHYDFFFLVCNDAVMRTDGVVARLVALMDKHQNVGILSPCAEDWGERRLLQQSNIRYFWYVNHIAWLVRRDYVESIMERDEPNYMNFLYDGSNFRGYESDIELIAKGYANDWAAAITTDVILHENEALLKTEHQKMKTDAFHTNRQRVVEEGQRWLRRKYGFNSRWCMQLYAQFLYGKFFEYHPQLADFRI